MKKQYKRTGTPRPSLRIRLMDQLKNGTHISQNLSLMKKYGVWKHGLSRTKAYSVWRGMMNRCYRKMDICYKNYGGRGILVCSGWHDVKVFALWFDKNYINGLTLNRIDNNKSYSPKNCNFISNKDQSRNKTTTKYSLQIANRIRYMYKNITSNQRELSRITGIDFRYINLIINNKRWYQ